MHLDGNQGRVQFISWAKVSKETSFFNTKSLFISFFQMQIRLLLVFATVSALTWPCYQSFHRPSTGLTQLLSYLGYFDNVLSGSKVAKSATRTSTGAFDCSKARSGSYQWIVGRCWRNTVLRDYMAFRKYHAK